MWNSYRAELFLLRKRTGTWVLLGLWTLMSSFFGYGFAYLTYTSGSGDSGAIPSVPLAELLPANLVPRVLGGFPFYGGAITLILGVLAFGSEFGWDTLKTVFTQRSGRAQIVGAKFLALGSMLVLFVLSAFSVDAAVSALIAWREGASIIWPAVTLLARGAASAWFLLAVWAALGALLAAVSRGTSLAIGVGVLWGLVIEGIISAFATQTAILEPVAKMLLRANGYSLIQSLGSTVGGAAARGPGAFAGPFVSETEAFVTLTLYLAALIFGTIGLLQRRDVQ